MIRYANDSGGGSFGTPIQLEKGHYEFHMWGDDDSLTMIRTSPPAGR
jgi:hypothetical protein